MATKDFDVFISYSRMDAAKAEELRTLLAQEFVVWHDSGIAYGDEFSENIFDGIRRSSILICLGSKHSYASDWVTKEVLAGLEHCVVVPIRLDDTPLPAKIAHLNALSGLWLDDHIVQSNLQSLKQHCRLHIKSAVHDTSGQDHLFKEVEGDAKKSGSRTFIIGTVISMAAGWVVAEYHYSQMSPPPVPEHQFWNERHEWVEANFSYCEKVRLLSQDLLSNSSTPGSDVREIKTETQQLLTPSNDKPPERLIQINAQICSGREQSKTEIFENYQDPNVRETLLELSKNSEWEKYAALSQTAEKVRQTFTWNNCATSVNEYISYPNFDERIIDNLYEMEIPWIKEEAFCSLLNETENAFWGEFSERAYDQPKLFVTNNRDRYDAMDAVITCMGDGTFHSTSGRSTSRQQMSIFMPSGSTDPRMGTAHHVQSMDEFWTGIWNPLEDARNWNTQKDLGHSNEASGSSFRQAPRMPKPIKLQREEFRCGVEIDEPVGRLTPPLFNTQSDLDDRIVAIAVSEIPDHAFGFSSEAELLEYLESRSISSPRDRGRLGAYLLAGEVIERRRLGYRLLSSAAESGDLTSRANLGIAKIIGIGTTRDHVDGHKLLMSALENGIDPKRSTYLFYNSLNGMGTNDFSAAFQRLNLLGREGNVAARTYIGIFQAHGISFETCQPDCTQAARKTAAELRKVGHPNWARLVDEAIVATSDDSASIRDIAGHPVNAVKGGSPLYEKPPKPSLLSRTLRWLNVIR